MNSSRLKAIMIRMDRSTTLNILIMNQNVENEERGTTKCVCVALSKNKH